MTTVFSLVLECINGQNIVEMGIICQDELL